ncbi:MAG TPA: DUF4097 family beta strand repeat-containing protein [Blastocatellia bacterium]|nr:DUF4097 family beta strand repeat-containing protein [Blastocatellia bacterium]
MFNKPLRLSLLSIAFGLMIAGAAAAQDFQKSYNIGAGGQISIGNISGDVIVTGYDGSAIIVKGTKEGRDRDRVEIEDRSSGNRVEVVARYPRECNCNASVKFEVQVPRSINYDFERVSSVSGNVEVSGVTGRVHALSVSGDVKVKDVSGTASGTSVSGDVNVEINRLEGAGDMKFSAVSGDVSVKMPSELDAEVDMSSFSGSIKTDFPIEVRSEEHGPRRWARGRLGDGSRRLKMSTISGSLSLLRQ